MRNHPACVCILTTLLAHAAPTLAQTLVDLRPKWEAGQTVRYIMKTHSESTSGVGAGQHIPAATPARKNPASQPATPALDGAGVLDHQSSTLDEQITFSLRAVSVNPEGDSTIEMKYERVKVKLQSGDTTVDFDSQKPGKSDDPIAAALGAVAGTTLTITMDSKGGISSVQGGGDALGLSSLLGNAGGQTPKDALGSIFPNTGNPAAQAKAGDTWTNSDELAGSVLGNVSMHTTYTVRAASNNTADIVIRGVMEPGSSGADGPVQVLSATTSGEYKWNGAAGRLESMSLEQSIRTRVSIEPGAPSTLRSESKTTIQRVDGGTPPVTPAQDGAPRRTNPPPTRVR